MVDQVLRELLVIKEKLVLLDRLDRLAQLVSLLLLVLKSDFLVHPDLQGHLELEV